MSDQIKKYRQFVDLLLEKTTSGKIPWNFNSRDNEISVWNDEILLRLARGQDENFEDLYYVNLLNKAGDILESFNDANLMNDNGPTDEKNNYFLKMHAIYTLAMRQATGADKALDDFMEALKTDRLDLPF